MSNIHQLVTTLAQLELRRKEVEAQLEEVEETIHTLESDDSESYDASPYYKQSDELNDILDDIYEQIDIIQEEIDEETSQVHGYSEDDF